MNVMGMINEFFVVPEELIRKRISEEFDVYEHIQNELVLFHEYQSLPFWRHNISFSTNKGWNATQAILNQLDQSEDKVLQRITLDYNTFLPNQFYKFNEDVELIWEYLKRISVADIQNFIKDETNRKRIEKKTDIECIMSIISLRWSKISWKFLMLTLVRYKVNKV